MARTNLVKRRDNGKLAHQVYRKPIHTNRYYHKISNHHPAQKGGISKTLTHRARCICESEHLPLDIKYLEEAFQAIEYSSAEIKRALHQRRETENTNQEVKQFSGYASLPYLNNVTHRISRLLPKDNIKISYKTFQQIRNLLRSTKNQ